MQLQDVRYSSTPPIAIITLDRPQARNAYSNSMIDGLVQSLDVAEADDDIRCVILTGEGKSFHAGGDLKQMQNRGGMFAGGAVELRKRYVTGIHRVPRRLAAFDKPVIAAINGAAIGAGLDLACMCDLRVASDKAKFGSTFVKVGLVPGDGGAYFLARIIGFPRALELMLTGRIVDAKAAEHLGLVHHVVAPDALMQAASELAREVAENAPLAVRLTKRAAYRSFDVDMDTALEVAASYQGMVQTTADHEEAVEAILAKRTPKFRGA